MPRGKASFSCDVNSGTGDLSDTGMNYADYPSDFTVPSFGQVSYEPTGLDDLGGSAPDHPIDNPTDPFDGNSGTLTDNRSSAGDPLTTGNALTAGTSCAGGKVHWYRRDKTTGEREHIKSEGGDGTSDSFSYSLTTADMDHYIEAYKECPDPGSTDGFGSEEFIGESTVVEPDTSSYTHARWTGTKVQTGSNGHSVSASVTTDWVAISSGDTLSIGPSWGTAGGVSLLTGSDGSFTYPVTTYQKWRSSVTFKQHTFNCSGGLIYLGGVHKNSYSYTNNEPEMNPQCITSHYGPTIPFHSSGGSCTWTISGSWEFSTDGTNPVQEDGSNFQWGGNTYED